MSRLTSKIKSDCVINNNPCKYEIAVDLPYSMLTTDKLIQYIGLLEDELEDEHLGIWNQLELKGKVWGGMK